MPIAARKSSGANTYENTEPRHRRRHTTHARSTTLTTRFASTSVLERAAGQDQEHVLERAATLVHRVGLHAVVRDERRNGVAVVGVDEHAVGQRLHPMPSGGDARDHLVAGVAVEEAQLHDLA